MPTTLGTMSGTTPPLTDPLVASDEVEGTAVFDASLERIGTVKNFMLTKREGRVSYVVISFGGFLGLGESHYPVPWEALSYDPELGGYVVNLERSRLADAPTIGGDDPFADPAFGGRVREYWAS
jgi:sporulation protein YlmC with PRC-barrel domain